MVLWMAPHRLSGGFVQDELAENFGARSCGGAHDDASF